jgi:hypothetical protein
MTKEEIIERKYNSTFGSPKYKDSVNQKLNLSYFLPAMDDYTKQQSIEFQKWQHRNKITYNPYFNNAWDYFYESGEGAAKNASALFDLFLIEQSKHK